MIQIPAALIEFDPNGNTIWIHGPQGNTILRIKSNNGIAYDTCKASPTSHCDLIMNDKIHFCLGEDAEGVPGKEVDEDEGEPE